MVHRLHASEHDKCPFKYSMFDSSRHSCEEGCPQKLNITLARAWATNNCSSFLSASCFTYENKREGEKKTEFPQNVTRACYLTLFKVNLTVRSKVYQRSNRLIESRRRFFQPLANVALACITVSRRCQIHTVICHRNCVDKKLLFTAIIEIITFII